jgi:regulator of protease activity HflC (stomatin/prohibitin superfamily)
MVAGGRCRLIGQQHVHHGRWLSALKPPPPTTTTFGQRRLERRRLEREAVLNAWIVFLIVLVPFLILLAFIAFSDSLITIPPGSVGLLLKSGQATDKVVPPGLHWVPRLRKRMVATYPSLELAFRAMPDGAVTTESDGLDRTSPPLRVTLGDRGQATIGYTVRFRIDTGRLRSVHERFGPEGFWNAVRDVSARALRHRLGESDVGVDDLFGDRRNALEEQIGESVKSALQDDAILVMLFVIGDVDLGRTGEVIQSTVRARLELEREQAESAVRMERARIDAELEPYLATLSDAALRYREVDVWRDLVHSQPERALPAPGRPMIAWANAELPEPPGTVEPAAAESTDET